MASCYGEKLFRLFYPNRPTRGPLRVWSPPPDPDRPSLPYLPGFKAHIQSHVAPAPFRHGIPYDSWPRKMVSHEELETLTQSALVVSHPPVEATTAPSDTEVPSETAQFTITSQIWVGCEGGTQIVVCTVEKDGQPPFKAVAKIYDALYYRFTHNIASRVQDITTKADKDYTAEAGAYKRLTSAERANQITPAYYRS